MNIEQLIADNTAALHRMADSFDNVLQFARDFAQTNLAQILPAQEPTDTEAVPEPLAATAEKPPVIEADPGLPPADEPLRYDQVAKAVTDLIKTNRQAGIDLLAQYKAKTLRDVPQEKWVEIKATAEQLLAPEAA